ncbi:excinuclease ABC subunit UvrC [Pseudothermotoga sp.]|nr:excinuclease ABC subunit UvrC [Pseudothermotoga sp.]MCX7812157.1 excinuclease ABC subunit UvrC [Pseudothermotoga sp.]MDW8139227.1 excinuclease ABC subunit UvrC [Pseudothermotoga sp.]
MELRKKAELAPKKPGVYIFYGKEHQYLYIGKAKNLYRRLMSYFSKSTHTRNPKIASLIEEAADLDYVIVFSEKEALLLEASLIYQHKPKYNIMLKESEYYPYIEITKEEFPLVRIVRKRSLDGEYYGPYTNITTLRNLLDYLQQVYQFRTCARDLKRVKKPCVEHHLHRCLAPCSNQIDANTYVQLAIEPLRRFLKGEMEETFNLLKEKMKKHAAVLDFENAAKYRDLLLNLQQFLESQGVVLEPWRNLDVIGNSGKCYVVLRVRRGNIVAKLNYTLDSSKLEDFLFHYYIVNQNELPELVLVKRSIKLDLGTQVRPPMDDVETELLRKAIENANINSQRFELNLDAMNQLKDLVGLEKSPSIIEGFDVAHLHGQLTVASVVVFKDGFPLKSAYRHYRLTDIANNDFAAIKNVLVRRYSKHPIPDLIFVDGGVTQVQAVVRALSELGKNCGVVGLSKGREIVCTIDGELSLPKDHPVLRLLVSIRDEAHRFANSFHRKLRDRQLLESIMETVPMIGPKRRKKLLKRFTSIEEIRNAPIEELTNILGSEKLAKLFLSKI